MKIKYLLFSLLSLFILGAFSACSPVSYPKEQLKEDLEKITSKEYGIDHIEIDIQGTTIGVYLPLEQLFVTDFKEAILSGKIKNTEALFEPTPEAIDKIENVLFSLSRVLLSTDEKLDFYFLQATDIEKTGMQLSLMGYMEDVKRLRFWDIPRSEYRKRVIHEVQLNSAAVAHLPARHFFRDLNERPREEMEKHYFKSTVTEEWVSEFAFLPGAGDGGEHSLHNWEILDIRSLPLRNNLSIVYVKVASTPKNFSAAPKISEYLFEITFTTQYGDITKIIPFRYLDTEEVGETLMMTKDIIRKSLDNWDQEFEVMEWDLGSFLAEQLSRRLQMLTAQDERIHNTFAHVKVIFDYRKVPTPHFAMDIKATLRDKKSLPQEGSWALHEDMLYLLEKAMREFTDVIRSYRFEDYDYMRLNLSDWQESWILGKSNLESFRKKRKGIRDILSPASLPPAGRAGDAGPQT